MRSRLKSNIKKKSVHILLIMAVIVAILIFFGPQLLIGFSTALGLLKGSGDQRTEITEVSYIAPPILNPISSATNKDTISITGSSTSSKTLIILYLNGEILDDSITDEIGDFSFKNVPMDKNNNEIKVRLEPTVLKKSAYSNSLNIKYIVKEPALEISFPQNEQKFKKDESPIKISGKADSGTRVTINDFWAISNSDGTFYYLYNLKDGDNNLTIIATDEAGNKTTKELKIKAE